MPVYDFKCEQCSSTKEAILSLADLNTALACECGGIMNRMLSAPAIIFKGSGFYSRDRLIRHSVKHRVEASHA